MGRKITSEQARAMRANSRGRYGKINPLTAATLHPSTKDIAWAAGIFEGEGCAHINGTTAWAYVLQKDRWLPDRLREFFGGTVCKAERKESWRNTFGVKAGAFYWRWQISGARGRAFLMTIYTLLSPAKKERVKWAMGLQSRDEYERKVQAMEGGLVASTN